jgi:hypothetical protein
MEPPKFDKSIPKFGAKKMTTFVKKTQSLSKTKEKRGLTYVVRDIEGIKKGFGEKLPRYRGRYLHTRTHDY